MYGYGEYINISPEQILQKVSQQQIFEFVLKLPFSFDEKYLSPFRDDRHPGCFFGQVGNTILFQDFGEVKGNTHRSCFRMVMDKYGVSLQLALQIICSEFNLSTEVGDYSTISPLEVSRIAVLDDTYQFKIEFEKKDYQRNDIIYWSCFTIRVEHLLEDHVYNVKRFMTRIGSAPPKVFTPYVYCYAMDFISSVKIYQPYSKYKWTSSCDENDIGNIDNLPPSGDRLIVMGSYKDHRVIRNTGVEDNVIWFQNEGCVPSRYILENLVERFGEIVVFFDNDRAGMKASNKLSEIFNTIRKGCSKPTWLPPSLGHKDAGEFVHREGRKDLIIILKQIGL